MTVRDYLAALIRTAAAALAGYVLAFLLQHGWDFPDAVDAQINIALSVALAGGYNAAVNWLTVHVSAKFGYLLIIPKTPVYGDKRGALVPEVPLAGHPPARRFFGGGEELLTKHETTGQLPVEDPPDTERGVIDAGTMIVIVIVAVVVAVVVVALLRS